MDGQYLNLWSTDNDRTDANDDKVIKSVYDPSPVGYSLPASNAFTGFTTTGWNVGTNTAPLTPETKAKFNVKGNFNKGWYFYTQKNKKGNTLFLQASGYRVNNPASVLRYNSYGCYWSTGLGNVMRGRNLFFCETEIRIFNYYIKADGYPVRSAEEKIKKYQSLTITV